MAYIITIANQKGGIGKSTTAQALGVGLSKAGLKSLLVDLDPQGNITYATRAQQKEPNSYNLLISQIDPIEAIQRTDQVDIIPADLRLSNVDLVLNMTGKEYRLKEALEPLGGLYDYIIIDTPPALGLLTINALTASQGLIIPTQADIYSLQGMGQLYKTIEAVKAYTNEGLEILGILLTRYHTRTILNRDMGQLIEDTAQELGTRLFRSQIAESVTVREAQAMRQDLYSYAPGAKPTENYKDFTQEVIERSQGHEQEEF